MGIEFEFFKAGNGDSILVSTYEKVEEKIKYRTRILIDGGHKSLYTRVLRNLKDRLDLVVMTHLDDDHILGLRDLLQKDVNAILKNDNYNPLIKEIWFNSFNQTSNDGDKIFDNPFESDNASIPNQIKFNKLLSIANKKSKKIDYQDYISVDDIRTPLTIGDVEIVLLSPNDRKLKELYCEYKEKIDSQNLSGSSYASDSDFSIEDLAKNEFDKNGDDSVANGSSIAFILIYKESEEIETKYLFLADAHICLINEELKKHPELFNNGKIGFEFIKLSHHGSKFNINEEFLNLVETNNYIILTDTENHYHPDKETLSKVIVHHKKKKSKANFIFNYSAGAKEERYDFTDRDIKLYQDYFELIHSEKYPMEE